MKSLLLLIFSFFLLMQIPALGLQAEREELDSTDSFVRHPYEGQKAIDIKNENSMFQKVGKTTSPSPYQYYFRVKGEDDYTKVSYAGENLCDYVYPVPESHNIMQSYRTLKTTKRLMFWGGIFLSAVSSAVSVYKKDFSPVCFLGVGITSACVIPENLSRGKVLQAIDVYNAAINEYDATHSAVIPE